MRKVIFFLILFLAIGVVMFSFAELENIAKTLARRDFRFLYIAIVVQMTWMLNDAMEYRALYKIMGINEPLRRLVTLAAAANFVNVVAPSGGMGGVAVFLDNAYKREHPSGRVVAISALYLFFDYVAFVIVLTLGIIVLFRRNNLGAGEIAASIIMLGIVIGLGAIILIGSRSAEQLGKVLSTWARRINSVSLRFLHRNYLQEERAQAFANDMAEGLALLRDKPTELIRPMVHALANKALMIAVMMFAFLDFQVVFTAGTLIAGFSIGYLFLVVSPTPSGIGIVETILPLTLKSLGVPWEDAVVVTLTYRAVTFWVPFILGGLAFRYLNRSN
jgi:uncharacterized protein (TIRG00374 family)